MNEVASPLAGFFGFFGVFMVVQVVILLGMIAIAVLSVIALWRLSAAHQSLAASVKQLAEKLSQPRD